MQPDVRVALLAQWPDVCIQMFEQNRAVKLLIDPDDGQILDANEAACAFYGYTRERLRMMTVEDITVAEGEEEAECTRLLLEAGDYFTCRHRLACGEVRDVEVLAGPLETAYGTLLYAIVHDITERRRAEQTLEHQAMHDPVTGLPNRMLLHDRLSQALLRAKRVRSPVALLLMDLDRFKEINDTFGHQYGDQVLEQVGRRLAHSLRQSDTVARLGGDEFAVVLPDTSEAGGARAARKLLDALAEPFLVDGHALQIEASIGIALDLEQAADRTALLRQADVAMYVAKRTSSGWAVYRAEDDLHSPRRLTLVGDLRRAIEAGALCLHYQPKLELGTGRVTGVEALVRWPHPERGMIPPDEFVGLAEATGLIRPLTVWVLNEALSQCRRWRDAGIEIAVAVNLSPRSLQDRDLVAMVQEHLDRWDADPEWLELEITESAIMADADRALETLMRLHDMGVKISIDDFGTGYSSLAYLRNLPLDEIKIDKSFILGMARDEDDAFIPQSVIDLGHNLGMQVVAEGVETQRILERLAAMGCDQAQGYHLSRPLPAAEIESWLYAGLAQTA